MVKDTSSPKANSKLDAFDIVFGLGKARELPKELIANLDGPVNVCNCVHGFKALTALVEFAYRRAAVPDVHQAADSDHGQCKVHTGQQRKECHEEAEIMRHLVQMELNTTER